MDKSLAADDSEQLAGWDRRHLWHPFTCAGQGVPPLIIHRGQDAVLTTTDGRRILDCISSWWVNVFGHGHPKIADAINQQARQLEHVIFAGFTHEPAARLSARLSEMLPGDLNRVFFSDNGSTSVEVALKMAAQYWQLLGQTRTRIMAFDGGYHGDTVGAMSAGVSSQFFDAWKRWLIDVDVMPFPATWMGDSDVESKENQALSVMERFLDQHANEVAAMIMEPLIQGASGMRMCRPEFLQAVVSLLRSREVIVVFDEVMTGFGRTGRPFACQSADVCPDIICLSKGLTGGFLPMSVTVASDRIFEAFDQGPAGTMFCHGHSYTANPLGCAAALASLDLLQEEETADNWQRIARHHEQALSRLAPYPHGFRRRQVGTIAALDVVVDDPGYQSNIGEQLKDWFWRKPEQKYGAFDGLLIRPLGNVVYLMPPYCITDEQLDASWQAIELALQRIGKN